MKASPLEYCLIGLIQHQQCSGYDLRKILTETPMRHYSDSPGSIYPALGRIARRGWIKATIDRTSRLRRVVYRLTPKGNAELKRWLSQRVAEEQIAYRLEEVMLRLSFHHLLGSAARLHDFLAEIGRAAQSYAAKLRQFIRTSTVGYPAGAALALKSGLNGYQSLARWANKESGRLQRNSSTAKPRAAASRRKKS